MLLAVNAFCTWNHQGTAKNTDIWDVLSNSVSIGLRCDLGNEYPDLLRVRTTFCITFESVS